MTVEERVSELEAGCMALLALVDALAVTHPNLDIARARAMQNAELAEAGMLYRDIPDSVRESFAARIRSTALGWTSVLPRGS